MIRILLVDDDELLRPTVAQALTERGFAVVEAADGEQAMKRFRAEQPDLVLTDLVMPNQEGIETIVQLRRLAPHLGIIAMSGGVARNPENYLKIAGALGANRTLRKPYSVAELFAAVTEVLEETGVRQEGAQAKTAPPSSSSPS